MANSQAPSSGIQLTFLSTGSVRIRPAMLSQPTSRSSPLLRRLHSLTSRSWSPALPVGVFLIHHPAGPILFDTGASPCTNDPGYFPAWNFSHKLLTQFTISADDGIVAQLRRAGVEPRELQCVVLSHLHHDHAGGLEELVAAAPEVEIWVGREHWEAFGKRPLYAAFEGCAPGHWPRGFAPRILEGKQEAVGPWSVVYPITGDGAVVAVDTPGHVPGHISLVVRGEDGEGRKTTFFLTGDATYGIEVLEREEVDGINNDPLRALQSIRMIKEFARTEDVVVLPSHDVDVEMLLAKRVVYKPKA